MIEPPKLNDKLLPQHIAIIMDGNGRWAVQRGKPRTFGHKNGVESVREVVESCAKLEIKYLTLYAFSKENWQRPRAETALLMRLLGKSLKDEFLKLKENNIILKVVGDTVDLPRSTLKSLSEVVLKTEENTGMVLTLALSYGSRDEITNTVKRICEKVKNNEMSIQDIDCSVINKHLYTHFLPDVDLLIRTSGEQRISNFMLWQCAYAEFFFTEILWPDFKKEQLMQALHAYQNRERRFGKLGS